MLQYFFKKSFLATFFALAIFFIVPAIAHGAVLYWVGGNGDSLNVNANDWSTTNPASCNNGGGDASAVPGASDVATFDPDCDSDGVWNGNTETLGGVDIKSGYSGSLNNGLSHAFNVGSFTQAGGTFARTGTNNAMYVTGDFTLSGGTFTAPSSILKVTGTFSHTGGTFTHNSGTVTLGATSSKNLDTSGGTTFNHLVQNDSLLYYLKLDDTSAGSPDNSSANLYSSGASTGFAFFDGTSSGATGTNNTPQPSTDVPSAINFYNPRSLSFDGTDDRVNLERSIPTGTTFTISAWVKPNSSTDDYGTIFTEGVSFGLWLRGGTQKLTYYYSGAEHFNDTALTNNTWQHVAVVVSGGNLTFYLNGVADGTHSGVPSINLSDIGDDGAGDNFKGNLDDIRVYNVALSSTEIGRLVAGNQPQVSVATQTLQSALDVDGNLVINSGTIDTKSGSNYGITVAGSWLNNGGLFTPRSGTVTFDGSSETKEILSASQSFNTVALSSAGSTYQVNDTFAPAAITANSNGTIYSIRVADFTISAPITKSSGSDSTLTIKSGRSIIVNEDITSSSNKLNLILNADAGGNSLGAIRLGNSTDITSNGGNVTLGGGSGAISAGSGFAYGTDTYREGIYTGGNINAGAGNIILNGTGATTTVDYTEPYGIQCFDEGGQRTIQTTTGNITLTGVAGIEDNAGRYPAIVIQAGCNITTTSGSITLNGTSGATTSNPVISIGFFTNITSSGTGSPGNITINGTLSGSSSSNNIMGIHASGTISAVDADIIITGETTGTCSSQCAGVNVNYGSIYTTGTGDVTITGTNTQSSGANNHGVQLGLGADANIYASGSGNVVITGASTNATGIYSGTNTNTIGHASGTGNITLIADSINLNGSSTSVVGAGNLTIRQKTNGTTIGLGSGAGTLNLATADLNVLSWGTHAAGKALTIGDANSGNITINTTSTIANKSVTIITGGNIVQSTNGLAHAGAAEATLSFKAYGNITLSTGIDASTSALNVLLQSDFDGNDSGYIALCDGCGINTNNGNLTMGGGSGTVTGVILNADGSVNTAASGYATGNSDNVVGISFTNPNITVGTGTLIMNGRGYNTTTSSNFGILGNNAGTISTTSGAIRFSGLGGGGSGNSGNNRGITAAWFTTATGTIHAYGVGGGAGTGDGNEGMVAGLTTTGNGTIIVNGTGGNGAASSVGGSAAGVFSSPITGAGTTSVTIVTDRLVLDGPTITVADGSLSITTSTSDVYLANGATVGSTGSGTIAINSEGGISTNNAGTNTIGGASATGNITVTVDYLNNAGALHGRTTGSFTIKPYTTSRTIGVAGGTGDLTLTSTFLGNLTVGSLIIGSTSGTGTTTVDAYSSWTAPVTFANHSTGTTSIAGAQVNTSSFTFNGPASLSAALTGTALTISSGTFTPGSQTITLTGTGTVFSNSGTYTAGTSTIAITDTSSTSKTFAGAGGTYRNLTITGAGSGAVIFTGANTFNDFTIGAPKTVTFPAGATTTIGGTFTCTGTSGNVITIQSSSSGSAATLSKSSGTVACEFASIKDSTATGGATFTANSSTNVSGNTGWTFTDPSLDQKYFRFYRDNASLNAADYYANINANYSIGIGITFRLRFEVANTGTGSSSFTRRLEFKEDSGAWTQITTDSNNVRLSNSSNFTDGTATTARLTATGSFQAGQGKDTSSDTSAITLAASSYTEDEYALILQSGAAGHTYQFRITNAGTALDTYTVTPSLTVDVTAPGSGGSAGSSLISYWKMDETSGNAVDSFGSNTLTDNNTVGTGAGRINTARDFEASNDEYFTIADNASLSINNSSFAISAWVKLESRVDGAIIMDKASTNNNLEYSLSTPFVGGGDSWAFEFRVNDGSSTSNFVRSTGGIATGEWYHLLAMVDSTNNIVSLAVNGGTPVTTTKTVTIPDGSDGVRIGYLYDGLIDEMRFYKRVLTDSEIADLANRGSLLTVTSFNPLPGPVAYWRLNEASGNATDALGLYDLTDNNTVGTGTGKLSGARDFESTNSEYFSYADNAVFSTGDIDFSASLWFKPEAIGSYQGLIGKYGLGGSREWVVSMSDTGYIYTVFSPNGTTETILETNGLLPALSAGNWYFIVLIHDSVKNEVVVSINNSSHAFSYSSGLTDTSGQFEIGRDGQTTYADGLIDEVGFWKRVLTSDERTALYNSGAASLAVPTVIKTTTPSIVYTLTEPGDCKASTTNASYTTMSGADCTGDGSESGTCLMSSLGANGFKNIYLACRDAWGNEDTADTTDRITYYLDSSAGGLHSVIIKGSPVKVKGNVIIR